MTASSPRLTRSVNAWLLALLSRDQSIAKGRPYWIFSWESQHQIALGAQRLKACGSAHTVGASSVVRFNTASSAHILSGSVGVLHSRTEVVEHAAMIESALEHRGTQHITKPQTATPDSRFSKPNTAAQRRFRRILVVVVVVIVVVAVVVVLVVVVVVNSSSR